MIPRWARVGPFGLLLLALAVLVFAATLVLSWKIADESDPPAGRAFVGETLLDDAPPADVAGTVTEIDGDVLSVRTEDAVVPVRVGSDALIQRLLPISPLDVEPGEWVILQGVVIAAPGEVQP
jgi:hypothetical protein